MDRQKVKEMRQFLNDETFKAFEAKFGVKVVLGNCRFDFNIAHWKFDVREVKKDGEILDPRVEDFKHFAPMYGLASEDLGKTFFMRGKRYKIVGLKTSARKNNIIIQDERGRNFVSPAKIVKFCLKGQQGFPTEALSDKELTFEMQARPSTPTCPLEG